MIQEFLNSSVGRQLTLGTAKMTYPKRWTIINIEGYNVCNLRCAMCPYEIMTRPKRCMSWGLYTRIVNDAYKNGIREANLNIYSEPLLDPLIFIRISYAKRKGMKVQLTSNGTLLNAGNIARLLSSGLDQIYFSFDGATKATYESIRRGSNFEQTIKGILALEAERKRRKSPLKITVVLVLQESNAHEADAFRQFWSSRNLDTYSWVIDNRRGGESKSRGLSPVWHNQPLPCRKLLNELNVLSDGIVALCCLDYDGNEPLSDLSNGCIADIPLSRRFKAIRKLHLAGRGNKVALCANCDVLHTCGPYWWGRLLPHGLHQVILKRYQRNLERNI